MSVLQWVGVNLLTGQIIADLPGIVPTTQLGVTIGQKESAGAVLNIDSKTNPSWLDATKPGASALIAYTPSSSGVPNIVGGWVVTQRVRDSSPAVTLGLETLEAYLDACYVGDYTSGTKNQDTIASDLMAWAMGTNRPAWTLTHLANASTATQNVTYTADGNVTVYAALQALSGVTGGPEWTCGWTWNLAASTITPTFTYGARIGQGMTGDAPAVTFEVTDLMPGSFFTEDYTSGQGANVITTYGTPDPNASSGAVATATATASDLKGRPLWEYRYQPNSTVSDAATLATYTAAALAQVRDGGQPLSLTVLLDHDGKAFGQDWSLGDDIGWILDGPAFPSPVAGVARCIGYKADAFTVTPVLKGSGLSL